MIQALAMDIFNDRDMPQPYKTVAGEELGSRSASRVL